METQRQEPELITLPPEADALEASFPSDYRWLWKSGWESKFENYERNVMALEAAIGCRRLKLLLGVLEVERYAKLAVRLSREGRLGDEWKYVSRLREWGHEIYESPF